MPGALTLQQIASPESTGLFTMQDLLDGNVSEQAGLGTGGGVEI